MNHLMKAMLTLAVLLFASACSQALERTTAMRNLLIVLMVLGLAGCNEASLSGSGGKKHSSDAQKEETKASTKKPKPSGGAKTTATDEGDDGDAIVVLPNPSTDTNEGEDLNVGNGSTDATFTPDAIVDGEEVINDCGRCAERARMLAPQAGFQADISRTYNEGFYKVDPSRGICDIHWMADMSIKIAEHDGQDSILDRQVALYCPCNCGWASEDFGPSGPGPDGGFDSQNGY